MEKVILVVVRPLDSDEVIDTFRTESTMLTKQMYAMYRPRGLYAATDIDWKRGITQTTLLYESLEQLQEDHRGFRWESDAVLVLVTPSYDMVERMMS